MTSLRQRMMEDMQVRNLSPHTQACYAQQVSLFARHFSKSPEVLGPEEIRSYQVYLTNEKKLAPGFTLIAVAALRFLYKVTLHKDWNVEDIIPAPKKPQKLPIVLSPEEVLHFLSYVASPKHPCPPPLCGSRNQAFNTARVDRARGVQRSLRPFPITRTWAPVPRIRSWRWSPVISERRRPVCTASKMKA